ncbi:hypothetical protein PG2006B_1615, partial [Bifidobacterium animalis subsp. animalis]
MASSLSQAPLRSSAMPRTPPPHITGGGFFRGRGRGGYGMGEAWRLSPCCRVVCIACVIGVVCVLVCVSFYVGVVWCFRLTVPIFCVIWVICGVVFVSFYVGLRRGWSGVTPFCVIGVVCGVVCVSFYVGRVTWVRLVACLVGWLLGWFSGAVPVVRNLGHAWCGCRLLLRRECGVLRLVSRSSVCLGLFVGWFVFLSVSCRGGVGWCFGWFSTRRWLCVFSRGFGLFGWGWVCV